MDEQSKYKYEEKVNTSVTHNYMNAVCLLFIFNQLNSFFVVHTGNEGICREKTRFILFSTMFATFIAQMINGRKHFTNYF